jgi:DNA topoisomerase-1
VAKEDRDGKDRSYKELILQQNAIKEAVNKEITGAEKAKLFPTDIAMIVNDFLVQHFPNVIDFSFTARVEKEFDEIAQGQKEWVKMLEKFYDGFHQRIEDTQEIQRSAVGKSRDLGLHPETGEKISVRLAKFGPVVQIGEAEEDKKPRYANLKKGQMMERLTLEEALDLFKLPREVGTLEDKPMSVAIGRFGPYIKHDNKFYSIGKEDDPYAITTDRAIEIVLNKRKADAEKFIKEFSENPEVKVLNGRFGPYISIGKKNIKIPKDKDPKGLTLEECLTMAKETPEKKGRFAAKKKAK